MEPSGFKRIRRLLSISQYQNPDETEREILNAIVKYSDLKPALDCFVVNNGTQELLLALTGRVGDSFGGIDVVVWMPTDPHELPKIFIRHLQDKPTGFKTHRLLIDEQTGQVNTCHMLQFGKRKGNGFRLLNLLDVLVEVNIRFPFEAIPFLYSEFCSNEPWVPRFERAMMTSDFLRKLGYINAYQATNVLLEAMMCYHELKPELDSYVFNNGAQERRLKLTGTIPIWQEESRYDVPVVIWLPTDYPYRLPTVFVQPPPEMPLQLDVGYLDRNGKVINLMEPEQERPDDRCIFEEGEEAVMDYKIDDDRRSADQFNLNEHIKWLVETFSQRPPVRLVPPVKSESLPQLKSETSTDTPVNEEAGNEHGRKVDTSTQVLFVPTLEEERAVLKTEVEERNELNDSSQEGENSPKGNQLEASFDEAASATASCLDVPNVPIANVDRRNGRILDGTMLVGDEQSAEVKIYLTRCPKTNERYLECRNFKGCTLDVPVRTFDENGIKAAYETMEQHFQSEHARTLDRDVNNSRQVILRCRYYPSCKFIFDDWASRDKHEVLHRTCGRCGKKFGKKLFEENPALTQANHKCLKKSKFSWLLKFKFI